MIQSISEKTWFKPTWISAVVIAGICLWAYVAGGILLLAHNKDFSDTSIGLIFKYGYYYHNNADTWFWVRVASALSLVVVLGPPTYLYFAPAKLSLFGNARWSTMREIEKAGLFGEMGIILGQIGKRFLMFAGQQHVIVQAPTRGWKGIAIAITNLLNFRDSIVCADMKQENYDRTSRYRWKRGHEVFLLNLAARDFRTHRWNPLGYISDDPNFRIDDIQKIAHLFFPDIPGTDPIWTATPRTLFLGMVLMLLETPGKLVTIGQVRRESLADGDGAEYFATLIAERAQQGRPFSRACVNALNAYISIAADATRTGIITSFRSRLELWDNPIIDAATSANDFDLRELRKKKMAIYVGFTPDNLERLQSLISLFFQQTVDLNIQELPEKNPSLKYSVLLLMDEFTAFGKLNIFAKGISFLAGYGLRVLTIIQSPTQTVEVYGEAAAENYGVNHAAQIVFAPKPTESKLAKAISEWLGDRTVTGVSESKSKRWFEKRSATENHSDQKRPLLLPQEIMELGQENEIVIMEHMKPIRAKKAVYFKSHVLVDRLKEVSPSLRALGKKLPNKDQLDKATAMGELRAPVPLLDLEAHEARVSTPENTYMPVKKTDDDNTETSGGKPVKKTTVERRVTAADVANLKSLPLASFAIDFSGIPQPSDGDLDAEGLKNYADELCRRAGITVS